MKTHFFLKRKEKQLEFSMKHKTHNRTQNVKENSIKMKNKNDYKVGPKI